MFITPDWLATTPARKVLSALAAHGYEAYYVGGCVRDSLMGVPVKDIDIATSAKPEEVTAIMEAAGMGVHPTGIAHGTVTVAVDRQAFEVTTFRKDVTTDGRNATVAFTNYAARDAQRRDFTVNALYMKEDGTVVDFDDSGLQDLMARRVRFVGDAATRCREDYLRVLRYFRFYAKLGGGTPDAEALEAVRECWPQMFEIVSQERILMELRAILSLPNPIPALTLIEDLCFLPRLLGTMEHLDLTGVHDLLRAEGVVKAVPDWRRRYAYLARSGVPPYPMSKDDQNHIRRVQASIGTGDRPASTAFQYRDAAIARNAYLVRTADHRDLPMPPDVLEYEIERGLAAELPVTGETFLALGIPAGPQIGTALHIAKNVFKPHLNIPAQAIIAYVMNEMAIRARKAQA